MATEFFFSSMKYPECQHQGWRRVRPYISDARKDELARWQKNNVHHGYSYNSNAPELNRADVEWMLATHENGKGPVIWNDESQRNRTGLLLYGFRFEDNIDLSSLPLAATMGYLGYLEDEYEDYSHNRHYSIRLEGADLSHSDLRGAWLWNANLQGAIFYKTQLEETNLQWANLSEANFEKANLSRANLTLQILVKPTLESQFCQILTSLV